MFCQNCGKEILDDSQFCMECGSPLYQEEIIVEESDGLGGYEPVHNDISADDNSNQEVVLEETKNKKKTAFILVAVSVVIIVLLAVLFLLKGKKDGEIPDGKNQEPVQEDRVGQEDMKVTEADLGELPEIIINTAESEKTQDPTESLNEDIESEGVINHVSEETSEEIVEETSEEEDLWQQDYYPVQNAFYGIWCSSSKDEAEMIAYAEKLMRNGFDACVVHTNDWTNLNNGWYSVTAGMYLTEEDAEYDLERVQTVCSDAYIKYSGEYEGY